MLVSIIVPVYNSEKYLEKCVMSILNQSFNDIEVILIDDGSCDESTYICDEFQDQDRRVVSVHVNNGGVSKARNIGIDMARGKYIMFCDSDDWVEQTWVESLIYPLISGTYDLSVSRYYQWLSNTKKICINESEFSYLYNRLDLALNEFYNLEYCKLLNPIWNKAYLKEIIDTYNIRFNEKLNNGEDLLFNLHYIRHAFKKIAIVDAYLYNYWCASNQSLSRKYIKDRWKEAQSIRDEFKECIEVLTNNWDSYRKHFYTVYLEILETCLLNNMSEQDKSSVYKKIKTNNNVLLCKTTQAILKHCDFKKRNFVYRLALKSRNYFWVWLYHKWANVIKTKSSNFIST